MADRSVKVILSAQVREYIAGMEQAAQSTRAAGNEAEKLAQKKADFQALGTAAVVVGGAITAVGLAALKTGISYNSMQQSSRAALQTMLGSAEAVNAQMDKLDAFAKGSPFSKQTFIQAQQQMLAFGIEAQKVVPYLESIQDAVAAAGGGNQQISEISFIMAQISSASKITAQDLLQFGQRGINAAELIGSQMGKTGAQIREDITAGTLGADQALDALAAGMAEKFGGAAANVKETFEGATDRVKAAWRDFSAELAKPLVNPEGGGMLIDFLNGIADSMRGFEKLPEPVKATISALTGLAGVTLLAGGTAVLAIPKWVAFREALSGVGVDVSALEGKLKGLGQYVGAVALAWGVLKAAQAGYEGTVQQGVRSQAELTNALLTSKNSVELLMAAGERGSWSEFWMGDGYTDTLENLSALLDRTGTAANNFFMHAWRGTTNQDIAALDSLERMGESLGQLASTDLPLASSRFADLAKSQGLSREETSILLDRMPAFKDALIEQANSMNIAITDANLLALATGKISPAAQDAAEAAEQQASSLEGLQGVARSTSDQVKSLADEIRGFGSAQFDTEKASIKFHDALDKLNAKISDGQGSLDVATEAGRDTRSMMLDVASATNDFAAAIAVNSGSYAEYTSRLGQGREALIATAEQLGMNTEAAAAWVDELISSPEVVETWVKQHGAEEAIAELNTLSAAVPADTIFTIHADDADAVAKIDGVQVARIDDKTAYVYGETDEANRKLNEIIGKQIPGKSATVSADTARFWSAWYEIQRAQMATKIVNIVEQVTSIGKNANGGMYAYADGGIEAYANGGFPPGLYSGGAPIHKFAEPETNWEAYISGKAGQEARNRQIWVAAGERLGMLGMIRDAIKEATAGAVQAGGSAGGPSTVVNYTAVNPVVRDDFEDAWNRAQEAEVAW